MCMCIHVDYGGQSFCVHVWGCLMSYPNFSWNAQRPNLLKITKDGKGDIMPFLGVVYIL